MKKIDPASSRRQAIVHALLFLGLFAFQALHLDSDPSPLFEGYQFNDEGYWNHSARCKVLFGTFVPDEFNQDVIASPLFTLIQWGVFSVTGVSLWTARLLPLVSLWLTLLMTYFLVKRSATANTAMLAVLLLGLMHEMLMYTKWSTPIITQGCLLMAVFWFWERGKSGSRWWMAASAAALVAGILTTLLTIHYLPGIALFWAIAWFLRKEVTWQKFATFAAVAVILGAAAIFLYYGSNYEQIALFKRTVGDANLHNDPRGGSSNLRQSLQALPFLEIFCSPGVAGLTMLMSFWIVDFFGGLRPGWKNALRQLSSLELYAVCWIVGAIPSIVATPTVAPRRFVIFLIPLCILAAMFLRRLWEEVPRVATAVSHRQRLLRIGLWCFLAVVWCETAWKCAEIIDTRWLQMAGMAIPPTLTIVLCAVFLALAAVAVFANKVKAIAAILVGLFFLANLTLTGIWYAHASYTVRDVSRQLGKEYPARTYFLGHFTFELALDNQVLPIYPPWGRHRMRMNDWFIDESYKLTFLASDDGRGDLVVRFPAERVKELGLIRLFPVIFGRDEFAYKGSLYLIQPPAPGAPAFNAKPPLPSEPSPPASASSR